ELLAGARQQEAWRRHRGARGPRPEPAGDV
ncbi:MAG: Nucleoid-associated protein YaaK, partial [uncultured Rubrobacteraceae bacterium]